ncbi:DUF2817 domain-containing protein [Pseudomonas sp. dw_358]|uniref:DUF2817 domain-containing protein n=1 Tax=Pseudomonas sp. dw_358 TaxID=2720083 RepID=UPI001BD6B8A7|nr:DUF2817 domain-containing protein [Pseudomonas sp. dw_358]
MSSFFPPAPSFGAQRARFLAAAHAAGATLHRYPHPLPGPFGEALCTDVAVLGDANASRLLVALSGTHGIEGYYGSDSQTAWLGELAGRELPADTAIVMVHLINPWGTAWQRRVNEDNLDLNRNYLDFNRPLPNNTAYDDIHAIYTCTQLAGPLRQEADDRLDARIAELGWQGVMAIVEAGQYRHADGLFFGGQRASWSNQTLHTIADTHLAQAKVVMTFDLHTGAGEYGHPMLLTIVQAAYPALPAAQRLFGPWLYTLITGQDQHSETGVAATATGYTSQALLDALPEVRLMPLVIECGTYPGAQIHQVLRDDHWLHLHGDPLGATGAGIKRALLEQFYPADPEWRAVAALRTWQIFERGLAGLASV